MSRWLKDHALLLLLFLVGLVAIVVYVATRGKVDLTKVVDNKVELIRSKAEVRKATINLGAAQAKQYVKEQYAEELQKLDEKQKERARELEDDPEALVEHLLRATR